MNDTAMRIVRLLLMAGGIVLAAAAYTFLQTFMLSHVPSDLLQEGARAKMTRAILTPIIVFILLVALTVKAVYWRRPVDRILAILGGYLSALFGPVMLAVLPMVGSLLFVPEQPPDEIGPGGAFLYLTWTFLYFAGWIAMFAFLPSLAVIAYAEIKRIRSPVFYALAAIPLVLIGRFLYGYFIRTSPGYWILTPREWGTLILGSALAGLFYWSAAARRRCSA